MRTCIGITGRALINDVPPFYYIRAQTTAPPVNQETDCPLRANVSPN